MDSHSGVPKASLANFVSTSVLTSSDGLFGDNVEEKRVAQAPVPRANDGAFKPLYEQLQERQEQKDSEWKEKNNPFAPPKGLDDEEYEYIKDLEGKKDALERKRKAQHEEDLAQFLVARGAPKGTVGVQLTAQQLQKHPLKGELKTTSKTQTAVVVVKGKQKAKDKTGDPDSGATESVHKVKERPLKKKQKVENSSKAVVGKRDTVPAAALGLVSYDSDSDSDVTAS